MSRSPQPSWHRVGAALLVLALLSLTLTCSVTSLRWIDKSFPGFMVVAHGVIASASLPHWPVAQHSGIYQHLVLAVNDQPVTTAEEIYGMVGQFPPGTLLTYTLRKDGHVSQVVLPSLIFTRVDYVLLFVAYLFNGVAIALIGIIVWLLKPRSPASQALCFTGVMAGVFCVTGTDLYSPHWFFRLHVSAEALFPAGLLHLALVFPVNRLPRGRSFLIGLPYLVSLGLGLAYHLWLYHADGYSLLHSLCMLYAGMAGLTFLGKIIWDYTTTDSPLTLQRLRVILLAFLTGYGFPAFVMLSAGLTGGAVPVNYAAFTGPVFPLGLGYAIVKHDLFDIDALLKRWTYYLMFTASLAVLYVGVLAFLNLSFSSSEVARSPYFPLLFAVLAVLLLNPFRAYLQNSIDLFFHRVRYNPKSVLEETSAAFASTLHQEDIFTLLWRTLRNTVGVTSGAIFLGNAEKTFYLPVSSSGREERRRLAVDAPLIRAVQRQRRILSLYDLEDEGTRSPENDDIQQGFYRLSARLLVPFLLKGELLGFLALGQKEAGTFFSADDRDFLIALANQSALSIANAFAYEEIRELNSNLENKVRQVQESEQEAEQSRAQLRRLSARLIHLQEKERERISRELHDHLGQILTAASMDIRWAQSHTAAGPETTERLEEAAHLVQAAIRATRQMSLSLRPETLSGSGLEVVLKQCAVEFERRSGLPVTFRSQYANGHLPSATMTNVYRIVQEALTNIARHAEATEVVISLESTADTLHVSVVDNGIGFTATTRSDPHALGLVGMQERATLLAGSLEVQSTPGAGVAVRLVVPLTAEAPDNPGTEEEEPYDYRAYSR
jgi:signal transduction histidine kinase